jgi:hypothetical protein
MMTTIIQQRQFQNQDDISMSRFRPATLSDLVGDLERDLHGHHVVCARGRVPGWVEKETDQPRQEHDVLELAGQKAA